MKSIAEEWNSTPVIARVALITSVIADHRSAERKFGSAEWDKVPEYLQRMLAPIFIPNTDTSDRTVHAGWSEGKPIYRASMAGHCIKELYLWRTGAAEGFDSSAPGRDPYRDKGELGAEEGSLHEAHMVEKLKAEGFEIESAGQEQLELMVRYKRFVVISHPDGLIRGMEIGPDPRVLECKALNEDRFAMWKSYGWSAFRNYAYQVSLEMFLASKMMGVEVKAFFYVKNRNTGETLRTLVNTYPIDPATIINKFSAIENLVEQGGSPPCDPEAEWYWCPFLGMGKCDALRKPTGEEAPVINDKAFEDLLSKMKAAKRMEKEGKLQAQALRGLIVERMAEPALHVGPYFAKLNQRTRTGTDIQGALAWVADHGGDPNDFTRETHYVELRVTGGGADDDDEGAGF